MGSRSEQSRDGRIPPLDLLLASVLTALCLVEIWVEPIFQTGIPGPRLPLTVFVLTSGVPLALRSVLPDLALVGYPLGMLLVAAVGHPDQAAFEFALGSMLVVYSASVRLPLRRLVPTIAVALLLGGVASWLTYGSTDAPVDLVVPLLLLAGSFAVGREVRHHHGRAEQAERAARSAEQEREQRIAVATAEERSRIARELHDIVAHGVSVMGLQAAGARSTLPDGDRSVHEAFRSIEDRGRATLEELHRMLAVLREGDEPTGHAPAPRLADLPELCTTTGAPTVRLEVSGAVRPLPPGLELSTYRIVQEALTNARRHANAALVEVTVAYDEDALRVVVRDHGAGARPGWEPGHGLVGIGERARLHGGSVQVDTAEGAGFRLEVLLPLGGAR